MVKPFGGEFSDHRRSLQKIKSATWKPIAARLEEFKILAYGPVPPKQRAIFSGPAVCRICAHRWNWAAPEETDLKNFMCPRCGCPSGEMAGTDYGPDDTPGSMCD